jgi:polysaccharide chain length determinant protein (PEP-CTERM system associated)
VIEIFEQFFFYLNGIWKRRWIALLAAWAVAIPGWLVVASMPSIYQSSSRIYVDTSSVLQPLLRGIAIPTNLQGQVDLMKQTLLSRPNLEAVARKTDYILTVGNDAEMESLLTSLQSRMTVGSDKQDIFTIAFEDTNPERARDVVQALLTIFVESNLGQTRKDLDTAEQFIDQQIQEYEKRLEDAEGKLARFRQEHIEVALGGDGGYLSRANAAENQAKQLEQSLEVAIAQRSLLRKQLEEIPATLSAPLLNGGPPDDTQARIAELEAKLQELKSQYKDKHPDVVRAQRELDALLAKQQEMQQAPLNNSDIASNVASEGEATSEGYGEPNPIYDQVRLRVIELETQIEDLRQRSTAARAEAADLASRAEGVPQIEAELQKLNRDYNIVKARHDELLARRESARMSRSRDDIGQQVQYRMIDTPMVPNEPAGPNRKLFLNVVAAGAIVVGLGLALLLVILDTSFSTLSQLRRYSSIVVLGAITDAHAGTRPVRKFADFATLGLTLVTFILALLALQFLERQYGLDEVVTAALSGNNFIHDGVNAVVQAVSGATSWIRAFLQI